VERRAEEVLHLGASDTEIAETLGIGRYMGGSLAMKYRALCVSDHEEARARRE
jgi:hypothetical protein